MAFLRSLMACCSICAYFIASKSTSHVWGWKPFLPLLHHMSSPFCTASSSFVPVKQFSIVAASSPTPSRTALPFFAAFLLTCFLSRLASRWTAADQERILHTHKCFSYRRWVTTLTNCNLCPCTGMERKREEWHTMTVVTLYTTSNKLITHACACVRRYVCGT